MIGSVMSAKAKHRPRRKPPTQGDGGAAPPAKPSDLVSSKIMRLANILRRSSTVAYGRQFGLSHVEWRIIALLGEHAPATLGGLSELMGLDKGQTSRAVSALVARRLVLRKSRPQGRGIGLTLSARGSQTHAQLMLSALARNKVLLEGVDEADKIGLLAMLDRLTTRAKAILTEQND